MAFEVIKERYMSKVNEVVLGATAENGGTRGHILKVGGQTTLPYLHFEGEVPHKPLIAMEITDVEPSWPAPLKELFKDVYNDPIAWAKKCVEEYKADVIYVVLNGADPDGANRSAEECTATVKSILKAVDVPLIVKGCGDEEKDNEVIGKVAEECAGENLMLGVAEQENYKSIAAACMVHKHSLIALSPLDINICKQLNILVNEMGLPLDRIMIDPMIGGLGYGIEYAYSIMERIRMGALQGDKMLSMPMVCTVGYEAWRAKEAYSDGEEFQSWGEQSFRGPLWEAMTAATLIQAGADILLMRHPQAVKLVQKNIAELMEDNKY